MDDTADLLSKAIVRHKHHREYRNNYYRQDKAKNNHRYVWSTLRSRSIKMGREFSLKKDDFFKWYLSTPKICSYCEIPEETWDLLASKNKIKYWGSTIIRKLEIDRIDSSKGYAMSNIGLACQICNSTKGAVLSYNEMRDIGIRYIKPKWLEMIKNAK